MVTLSRMQRLELATGLFPARAIALGRKCLHPWNMETGDSQQSLCLPWLMATENTLGQERCLAGQSSSHH